MQTLGELMGDLELVLMDLKIESMISDLIEHTQKAEDYDEYTKVMARSRTVSFICNHVKDFDVAFCHLSEYHDKQKKMVSESGQLVGNSDSKTISNIA